MTAVIEARGLGKRYGHRWALSDCTLAIPPGYVAGLVGPNGAGKTTLLQLAVGLLSPTAGVITVLGAGPADGAAQLRRVGFLAQDAPVYSRLTVADHLRLGAWLNPAWDDTMARQRVARLGLDPAQRAGKLSGGQRAQLALTLAIAKQPALLLLDEPVASLDPLARRDFLEDLAELAAEHAVSVVLSSHLVADLERTCDYLLVMAGGQVQVTGLVADLLAGHRRLSAPSGTAPPPGADIIEAHDAAGRRTLLLRGAGPAVTDGWTSEQLTMEHLVLGYMSHASPGHQARISAGASQ